MSDESLQGARLATTGESIQETLLYGNRKIATFCAYQQVAVAMWII